MEAFTQLEQEMQNKFAELASSFDFGDAEQKAIDALNDVYRLADRAKGLLDQGLDFHPNHKVVNAQDYDNLFAKYMMLEAELRTFFAGIGFSGSTPNNAARFSVPVPALTRLFESFQFGSVESNNPAGDSGN